MDIESSMRRPLVVHRVWVSRLDGSLYLAACQWETASDLCCSGFAEHVQGCT